MNQDPKIQEAVNKLKGCQDQGLKYYDAVNELKKQGYSETQIESAADNFQYNTSNQEQTEASDSISNTLHDDNPDIDELTHQGDKNWHMVGGRFIWTPTSVPSWYLWLVVIFSIGILIFTFKFDIK